MAAMPDCVKLVVSLLLKAPDSGIRRDDSKRINRRSLLPAIVLFLVGTVASAGEVDVKAVSFSQAPDGSYRFEVTLQHADAGLDHYADRWEVLTPDGNIIATRTLYHPHVNEQPFTRGLSGVKLPEGVRQVVVRGHDSVHGYGGRERRVELPVATK